MYNFFEYISKGEEKVYFRYLDGDGNICEIKYNEYADDICEAYNSLCRKFSDIRGRHIGVLSSKPYETMVVMAAAVMGKAILVPINLYESPENIEYIIDNADIEILLVSDDFQKYQAEHTVNISELVTYSRKDHFKYDKTMDEFSDDSYLIIYTSGTTGRAKGAILPFENFTRQIELNVNDCIEMAKNIRNLYITVPLYHVWGILYWIEAVYAGWVIHTNQNAGNMLHDLKIFHPEFIVAAPAFTKMLERYIKNGNEDEVRSLKYIASGGAKLSEGTTARLLEYGISCLNGYGMTETSAFGTFNKDAIAHPESIGTPMPGVEVKIIDGEMCIGSSTNMKGYYKNEEATAECLIDGMVHTGDIAYIDEDGYVYITGRKKNLIILSGGENVSPEEIESKLYLNPNIKECKVIEKNDRICAGVFADAEFHEEIREFISKLNTSLPIFKRITSIEFRDKEFEKTANGKIKR